MFTRTPAWHRLGKVLPDWPGSWEEARLAAGLTWEVESRPIYQYVAALSTPNSPLYAPIPGWHELVRNDTFATLSVQQESYAVIGNSEFGNMIEYLMGADLPGAKDLKYETLVSLKGGQIIAVTLYLDQPITLPHDPSVTVPYIVLRTRHDGSGGFGGGATGVRVVCANTLAAAEANMESNGSFFTIRHTSNWASRTEEARMKMAAAIHSFADWKDTATALANQQVSTADTEQFLDFWMPYSTAMTVRQRESTTRGRAKFRAYYDSATCEGIAGTKWGLLQAAVELCDHGTNSRSSETEVNRVLVTGDTRKAKALVAVNRL